MYKLTTINGRGRSDIEYRPQQMQESNVSSNKNFNKTIDNNFGKLNKNPTQFYKSTDFEQTTSYGTFNSILINQDSIPKNNESLPLTQENVDPPVQKHATFAKHPYYKNRSRSTLNGNQQVGPNNDIENTKSDHILNFQERILNLITKVDKSSPKSTLKKDELSGLYNEEDEAEKYAKLLDKKIMENRVDFNRYTSSPDLLRIAITMVDDAGQSTIFMHKLDPKRIQNRLLAKYQRVIINKEYKDVNTLTRAMTKEYNEIVNKIKSKGFKIYAPSGYKAALRDFNDFYRPKLPDEDDDLNFDKAIFEDIIENGIDEHLDTIVPQHEDEGQDEGKYANKDTKQVPEAEKVRTQQSCENLSLEGLKNSNKDDNSSSVVEEDFEENEYDDMDEGMEEIIGKKSKELDDKNNNYLKNLPRLDALLKAESIFDTLDIVMKKKPVQKANIPQGYRFHNDQDKETYVKLMTWHDEIELELLEQEAILNKFNIKAIEGDEIDIESD